MSIGTRIVRCLNCCNEFCCGDCIEMYCGNCSQDGFTLKSGIQREKDRVESGLLKNCPDCGVIPGQPHLDSCDVERCSACGRQRLMCETTTDCENHDKAFSRWTGFWPGKLESDFLGIDLNEFNRRGLYEVFFIKPKDGRNLNFESWLEKKIYEKLGFSIEDDDVDLIVDIAREAFTKGRQIERENYEKLHAGQAGNEESAKNTASDAPDERR